MFMRKHAFHQNTARRRGAVNAAPEFAPEAYGDFPAVPDDKIEEVRREMADRFGFGGGKWQIVEDVAR